MVAQLIFLWISCILKLRSLKFLTSTLKMQLTMLLLKLSISQVKARLKMVQSLLARLLLTLQPVQTHS